LNRRILTSRGERVAAKAQIDAAMRVRSSAENTAISAGNIEEKKALTKAGGAATREFFILAATDLEEDERITGRAIGQTKRSRLKAGTKNARRLIPRLFQVNQGDEATQFWQRHGKN